MSAEDIQVVCLGCRHTPMAHRSSGCTATVREGPGDERYCGCTDYRPWLEHVRFEDQRDLKPLMDVMNVNAETLAALTGPSLQEAERALQEHLGAVLVPDQAPEAVGDTTEGREDAIPALPRDHAYRELASWWRAHAEDEIRSVVPKAIEYGSGDLADIGRELARFQGIQEVLTDQRAVELGIFFYVKGKLARWADALLHQRECSLDTLFDLDIYTKMAIRNREVGGWPGITEED